MPETNRSRSARLRAGLLVVLACALLGGGYLALNRPTPPSPMDHMELLSPTADAIKRQVAQISLPTSQDAKQQVAAMADRQNRFAELFTKRFRESDAHKAVRAEFFQDRLGQTRIKLKCEARMEPCDMDNLALMVWRESHECLGRVYDVDIYETFIGALPRKLGELRNSSDKTPMATISYIAPENRGPLQTGGALMPFMHATPAHAPAMTPAAMRGVRR